MSTETTEDVTFVDASNGRGERSMKTTATTTASVGGRWQDRFVCGVVEGFYGRPWTTEQRRHLFGRQQALGMNAYLYAPKDDLKHRAQWRELYTPEETDHLQGLIQAAKEHDITFVYALSPGIDIIYSSPKDQNAVKHKLEQVKNLGCDSFALLFDDIETTMNEADKTKFDSFAVAQVTVSNDAFEYLGCPQFFFCPTEYCESRAVPNLNASEYLNALGKKLLPDIQILWTGPRVVSRLLTVGHLRKVAKVLRRKPVIWDNLHANDYDPKRVYLGPYSGRSVSMKQEVAGVFTNPNCEYETNFVALYTLAQWNRSDADANVADGTDATLEAGGVEPVADQVVSKATSAKLYHPLKSLDEALVAWLHEFSIVRAAFKPAGFPVVSEPLQLAGANTILSTSDTPTTPLSASVDVVLPVPVQTCTGNELAAPVEPAAPIYTAPLADNEPTTTMSTTASQPNALVESSLHYPEEQPLTPSGGPIQAVNSLTYEYSEPMELVLPPKDETVRTPEMMDVAAEEGVAPQDEEGVGMDADLSSVDPSMMSLLADLFFLPFEHGTRARYLIDEFRWLRENAGAVVQANDTGVDGLCKEWQRRTSNFLCLCRSVTALYRAVMECPNRALVHDLYPYLWEAQSIMSIVDAVISWMAAGHHRPIAVGPGPERPDDRSETQSNQSYEDACEHEPWVYRGGVVGDFEKLLMGSASVADMFLARPPIPLPGRCFNVRPYESDDRTAVYDLAHATFECTETEYDDQRIFSVKNVDLIGDRYVAPFLDCATPLHAFVAEEILEDGSKKMVAFALAALDAASMARRSQSALAPEMRRKYSEFDINDNPSTNGAEESLSEEISRWGPRLLPEGLYRKYPSQMEIRCRADSTDTVAARRLALVLATTLALNGSSGVFCSARPAERTKIEVCSRVGLFEMEGMRETAGLCMLSRTL